MPIRLYPNDVKAPVRSPNVFKVLLVFAAIIELLMVALDRTSGCSVFPRKSPPLKMPGPWLPPVLFNVIVEFVTERAVPLL